MMEIKVEGESHTSWAHVDEMTEEHNSNLSHAVQCALWRHAELTKKTTHSRVRVHVLCVEDGLGCYVVIGVGRVIVQRHHADITPSTEIFL